VGGRFWFSPVVAFKIDTMNVGNDSVEDGIGDRWLANHVVRLPDGQLRSDEVKHVEWMGNSG
jgi:hypothetical protein